MERFKNILFFLKYMVGTLIEVTLGESGPLTDKETQSFNNDRSTDKERNSFKELVPSFCFYAGIADGVPKAFLFPNVHRWESKEIYKLGKNIVVGEYCNKGVIVPAGFNIAFNQLYNCAPLISLIKGKEEYISFLHTWAIPDDSRVVDRQVKHWMKTIAKKGDISETIFAPRKNSLRRGADTKYQNAIEDITRISQKTIVLTRNVPELRGIANREGVYFEGCGYHLWEK